MPTVGDPWAAAISRSSTIASDLPAPAGHAVGEVEGGEQLVPARVDGAGPPFVGGEPDAGVAEDEHRIEGGEAEHSLGRPVDRDDEKPVVAPRAEPGDGAHRVAADAVGDEPFALRPPRRACRNPAGRGGSSRPRLRGRLAT